MDSSKILEILNNSRKELLDLGLRNSLINYRARSRKIDIVNEKSKEIYRILVNEGKKMYFTPLPEGKNKRIEDLLLDQLGADNPDWKNIFAEIDGSESNNTTDRYTDNKLQTKLTRENLLSRLLSIHYNAKSHIEEQGINILYLACGFLEWYEANTSDIPRKAPIVLIPVELSRSSVQERFSLAYTGEDIGANLSLLEKLKQEFDISLPEIDSTEDLEIEEYFKQVKDNILGYKHWKLFGNEIVLGFFSFGKFLMYKDLDPEQWPSKYAPQSHKVLTALLGDGFEEKKSEIDNDTDLDVKYSPEQMCQVMDADSTQTIAILDVKNGRNMVIQGPPGTGKSQTITNVLSEKIKDGQKVLFVSEKMAALEVVKRRLDQIGIGEAVLELHSHKANKKAIIEELNHTFNLGMPKANRYEDEINSIAVLRDQLNRYCHAVNKPILNSGKSPVEILGLYLRLGEDAQFLPRIDFNTMKNWEFSQYKAKRFLVEKLQRQINEIGPPYKNLFFGSKRKELLPPHKNEIERILRSSKESTKKLGEIAKELAESLCIGSQTYSVSDIEIIIRAAKRAIDAPHKINQVKITTNDWQVRNDDIRILIKAGKKLSELHHEYDNELIAKAWNQDFIDTRQVMAVYGNKWWRFLSGKYRNAKNQLTGFCRNPKKLKPNKYLLLIDAVLLAQENKKTFEDHESLGKVLFGAQWEGENSDWKVLEKISTWIVKLYQEIGEGSIPNGILKFLQGASPADRLSNTVEQLSILYSQYVKRLEELWKQLEFTDERIAGFKEMSFADQEALIDSWIINIEELLHIVDYNIIADELEINELNEVVKYSLNPNYDQLHLLRSFDASWFLGLLEYAYKERNELKQFNRISHEHIINNFAELDKKLFLHNRAQLAYMHWSGIPNVEDGVGELAIIRAEANKKRRILPIRKLIDKAGRAIQSMKPVFMMSPMSIAKYIPPGSLDFDLVIFDEASQVKPVEAFGAILRAEQAVVVGDNKQLPPTTFFDSLLVTTEEEEDYNSTADLESILGLFLSKGAPERMLEWHYRSRHESLIATSNYEFYDNRLVIFPSPDSSNENLGLKLRYLPNADYDRGKSRTNKYEAKTVAEEVMRHAKDHPNMTLGVVAFSTAQRNMIQFQLEYLRKQDFSSEDYFSAHSHEPFFIKNLENVQGDERDVIFISIGYGKSADGKLSMNFGPLTKKGGERRLNVLITRARHSCEVFCNFNANDIDISKTHSRGVRALKSFLHYAEFKDFEVVDSGSMETDSPFEDAVVKELNNKGYDIRTQVGCAGFRIDIGVIDPDKPGRYLIGIECDGATYHSAKTARDRDRLRQEVLEKLGWKIHRIWSTDWFKNPKEELERVITAIEKAKILRTDKENVLPLMEEEPDPEEVIERTEENRQVDNDSNTYNQAAIEDPFRFGSEILDIPPNELGIIVKEVVDAESPIHFDELAKRVAKAYYLNRVGNRIKYTVHKAVDLAVKLNIIKRKDSFLWSISMKIPSVRDRSDLNQVSRRIEYISPEEIIEAMRYVIRQSFSVSKDELTHQALNKLGIKRLSININSYVHDLLEKGIRSGIFIENSGIITIGKEIRDYWEIELRQ